jgi:hypothetical protein
MLCQSFALRYREDDLPQTKDEKNNNENIMPMLAMVSRCPAGYIAPIIHTTTEHQHQASLMEKTGASPLHIHLL